MRTHIRNTQILRGVKQILLQKQYRQYIYLVPGIRTISGLVISWKKKKDKLDFGYRTQTGLVQKITSGLFVEIWRKQLRAI